MANNRMYLVHKVSGQAILLAKYYPQTGWCTFHPIESYDEFFDLCKSQERGTFGDQSYELRFEAGGVELIGDESFPFNIPSQDMP